MRHRIDEAFTRRATAGDRRSPIFMDREVIGFGLQVRPSGRKTFTLDYTLDGRRRRLFIGDHPAWSAAAAREEARRLRREIDRGVDPLVEREERAVAPTVADLAVRYLAEHVVRQAPTARADIERMLRTFVLPAWGARKVADIRAADVDRLLADAARGMRPGSRLSPRPTPIRANRLGAMIRKMFNLAIRWEMRADNPARGFVRNPEPPREKFLSVDELGRLAAALEAHPNRRMAGIVRLLLLTGARRGEVLAARWEQFDLEAGVWLKPASATKQRRAHRTPLSAAAVELLRTIRAEAPSDCPWVFPGDAAGRPVRDIRRFWFDMRRAAGLGEARIHDLRHSFASLLASGGMSLPMIGRLLGHSQPQTTARYAHLFDDPLRAGVDRVADALRTRPRTDAASADPRAP